jgi:hypothetical protein
MVVLQSFKIVMAFFQLTLHIINHTIKIDSRATRKWYKHDQVDDNTKNATTTMSVALPINGANASWKIIAKIDGLKLWLSDFIHCSMAARSTAPHHLLSCKGGLGCYCLHTGCICSGK